MRGQGLDLPRPNLRYCVGGEMERQGFQPLSQTVFQTPKETFRKEQNPNEGPHTELGNFQTTTENGPIPNPQENSVNTSVDLQGKKPIQQIWVRGSETRLQP